MHKHAAATTLAIALNTTMLALAVSASLTPANAHTPGAPFCGNSQVALACKCQEMRDYAHAAAGTLLALGKKWQACESKWVNALEASRGIDGRIDRALASRIFVAHTRSPGQCACQPPL
jgi:hypothetical protein